jgi:flagellar protein FliJ
MTFQYSYEHILNLKEKEKDQAFSELGQSLRKKERIQLELDELLKEKEERLVSWGHSNKPVYISVMQQRSDYLEYVDKKIAKIEAQLAMIESEIAIKKAAFLDKQKDEKTWSHLREKAHSDYLENQKKEEQKFLDEVAVIRHYHQKLSY